jgi:hypothetical protein
MPAAQISDWLRREVGLPASAIDEATRRLDGSVLRLLFSRQRALAASVAQLVWSCVGKRAGAAFGFFDVSYDWTPVLTL